MWCVPRLQCARDFFLCSAVPPPPCVVLRHLNVRAIFLSPEPSGVYGVLCYVHPGNSRALRPIAPCRTAIMSWPLLHLRGFAACRQIATAPLSAAASPQFGPGHPTCTAPSQGNAVATPQGDYFWRRLARMQGYLCTKPIVTGRAAQSSAGAGHYYCVRSLSLHRAAPATSVCACFCHLSVCGCSRAPCSTTSCYHVVCVGLPAHRVLYTEHSSAMQSCSMRT